MNFLQINPVIVPNGLQSDWGIIIAIAMLASLQGYKIWADARASKTRVTIDARLQQVMTSIELYLKILSDKYTEEVTDIQMPILVEEFVLNTKGAIMVEAMYSIIRNDIKNNRNEIHAKLEQSICNRYRDLVMNIGRFKYKGRSMSEFVDISMKEKITKNVLDIVLKERDTESQKQTAINNLQSCLTSRFDELHNSILERSYT
jgi:hypothetical protein